MKHCIEKEEKKDFNPTLVQFKHTNENLSDALQNHFNPTLVQFKQL